MKSAWRPVSRPRARSVPMRASSLLPALLAGAIPVLATPIPRNNWTNATTMSPTQLINDPGVNLPSTIRRIPSRQATSV